MLAITCNTRGIRPPLPSTSPPPTVFACHQLPEFLLLFRAMECSRRARPSLSVEGLSEKSLTVSCQASHTPRSQSSQHGIKVEMVVDLVAPNSRCETDPPQQKDMETRTRQPTLPNTPFPGTGL